VYGQYDIRIVVLQSLGHALGVGNSIECTLVMHVTLDAWSVNQALTTADLNGADSDSTGACGLHAVVLTEVVTRGEDSPAGLTLNSYFGRGRPLSEAARDYFFTVLGAQPPAGTGHVPASPGEPSYANKDVTDAVFGKAVTERMPSQEFALTRSETKRAIFAAQLPRDEADLVFDLFPGPTHDSEAGARHVRW